MPDDDSSSGGTSRVGSASTGALPTRKGKGPSYKVNNRNRRGDDLWNGLYSSQTINFYV